MKKYSHLKIWFLLFAIGAAAIFIIYGAIDKTITPQGYVCLKWLEKPDTDFYILYYIEDSLIKTNPRKYSVSRKEGGDPINIKRWRCIMIPANTSEAMVDGLEPEEYTISK